MWENQSCGVMKKWGIKLKNFLLAWCISVVFLAVVKKISRS